MQMVCQEQEGKLERQQGRIEHLEKFLKQSDEDLAHRIKVAEREAWVDANRGAQRLEQELLIVRANYRLVNGTLKDLTNDGIDLRCAAWLQCRGELANRISDRRKNWIAQTIRRAYNEVVAEDENSGVSTPEHHPKDGAP